MPAARPSTAGSHAFSSDVDTEWESASDAADADDPYLDADPSPTSFSDAGGDDLPPPPRLTPADEAGLRSVSKLTLPAARAASAWTVANPNPNPNPNPKTADFYLVGTAHVSPASCADVEAAIAALRPQVVLVELCSERAAMLRADAGRATPKPLNEALADWRAGRASLLLALYSWMLGQAGDAVASPPGEEFRVAVRAAAAVGAKVVLGDRPVSVTLARTWAALSPWDRVRFVWELVWTGFAIDADELKKMLADVSADGDAVTAAILEMGAAFPTILPPLLYERDQYMVHVCRSLRDRGVVRAVAVVGAGHVGGMKKAWDADVDVDELMRVPVRARNRWLVVGVAAGAVVAGVLIVRSRRKG